MLSTRDQYLSLGKFFFGVVAGMCAACTAPPKPSIPEPQAEPVVREEPQRPPITPESKAQAQKRAIEARDLLQNGDESSATTTLEQALMLDPANELAHKLLDQIKADPEADLGSTHFDYAIQAGDSLSKLAERFLGDRLRFYILARYNGIANPSRVSVGQSIKIPGRAAKVIAPTTPSPQIRTAPGSPVIKAVPQKPAPHTEVEAPASTAPSAAPSSAPVVTQNPSLPTVSAPAPSSPSVVQAKRKDLVKRYNQEALAAFHKQDLDSAIRKWDQVLELEPDNDSARLNRAKAIDLKARIEKFPKR